MVKKKLPHLTEVLEVMGLIEQNPINKAIGRKPKHQGKPISMYKAAKALNCSYYHVKKILTHGDQSHARRPGAAHKQTNLTLEQHDYIKNHANLSHDANMGIKEKLQRFNEIFGTDMKHKEFRGLYRGLGITNQSISHRLGGEKLKPVDIQEMLLHTKKIEFQHAIDSGYEIVQIDEALFNPDSFKYRSWAPVGHPVKS